MLSKSIPLLVGGLVLGVSCGEDAPLTYHTSELDGSSLDAQNNIDDYESSDPNIMTTPSSDSGSNAPGIGDEDHFIDGKDNLPDSVDADNYPNTSDFEKEWQFTVGRTDQTTIALNGGSANDYFSLVLSGKTSDSSHSFTQISRQQHRDHFDQLDFVSKTDNFIQSEETEGVVDILVVIDNSGSMQEEQQNLATKLDPLLSFVSGSEWKIAVTTTDPLDGCLTDVISKTDSDALGRFSTAVTAGTNGTGNERGVLQAVNGLKGECLSSAWLRQNSTVAVLIVSDEDNCSDNGQGCAGQDYGQSAYLTDYLASIRTVGTDARIYGIFSDPGATCPTAYNNATQYSELVGASGGTSGDICDSDYSTTLSSISANIAGILKHQFALSHTPSNGTAEVRVDGTLWNSGYTLSGNTIEFTTLPANGASISVSYNVASQYETSFKLSAKADTRNLSASINGQLTSAYSYDAITSTITFANAPPPGSSVDIDYLKLEDLISQVFIGKNAVESSIKTFANGVAQSNHTYDKNTGMLQFILPPMDNASVAIEFIEVMAPNLKYRVAVQSNLITQVQDAQTNAPVSYSLDQGLVIIAAEEFALGRTLHVQFDNPSGSTSDIVIDTGSELHSVILEYGGGSCDITDAVKAAAIITWQSDCGYSGDGPATATASYRVNDSPVIDLAQALQIEALTGIFVWRVWIDTIPFYEADVIDGKLIFLEELPFGAEVVARAHHLQ